MGEAKDGATDRSAAGPHCRLRGRRDGTSRRAGAAQDAPALRLHRDRSGSGGGASGVGGVTVGGAAAGQRLGTMKRQERTGVIVFALREAATQRHVFNPPPDRVLETGDVLMGCAAPEQVAALQRIVTEG